MPLIEILALFLSAISLSIAQDDQACYWRSNDNIGVITDGSWFACNNTEQVAGGAQLCCLQGSQCGSDAMCHQSSSGGGSGWFVGGCTDPTYQDPACRSSCTGDGSTWIQYNYTSQLWHCCGDGGCTGTPSSETFQAAPPEQFSAVPSGPQSDSSSPTPTNATSPTPVPSTELSSGAKAGLGVAAAAAGIAIAAAIAFFILWRKAKKAAALSQSPQDKWQQEQGMGQQYQQVYAHHGSQPANYYQTPPEEMALNQMRTPELAGEELGDERK